MVPGITGVNYALAYHETYFDLAGMALDEKTLFFDAADAHTITVSLHLVGDQYPVTV